MKRIPLKESGAERSLRSGLVPGMAYFAGTGPKGTVCRHCRHFTPEQNAWRGRCLKAGASAARSQRWIFGTNASCKYFDGEGTSGG